MVTFILFSCSFFYHGRPGVKLAAASPRGAVKIRKLARIRWQSIILIYAYACMPTYTIKRLQNHEPSHLEQINHRSPRHEMDFSGTCVWSIAHLYNLRHLAHVFLGWSCATRVLHNASSRQIRI